MGFFVLFCFHCYVQTTQILRKLASILFFWVPWFVLFEVTKYTIPWTTNDKLCQMYYTFLSRLSFKQSTPNHLLLDSAPNLGPLISRWKINKFENCWYRSVRILEVLKLLFQQPLNLSSSQWDMRGPILGALSKNRWLGVLYISERARHQTSSAFVSITNGSDKSRAIVRRQKASIWRFFLRALGTWLPEYYI